MVWHFILVQVLVEFVLWSSLHAGVGVVSSMHAGVGVSAMVWLVMGHVRLGWVLRSRQLVSVGAVHSMGQV